MVTDGQLLHRQYLQSETWKAKRLQALVHHGCVCSRCGEFGSDVHHRTYERVGGAELMEDLEVMCRPCHEAHHAAERSANAGRRRKSPTAQLSRQALVKLLTAKQKRLLREEFGLANGGALYLAIIGSGFGPVVAKAEQMMDRKVGEGVADAVSPHPVDPRPKLIEFLAKRCDRPELLDSVSEKNLQSWVKLAMRGSDLVKVMGKRYFNRTPESKPL
jgi:hypothetical protein